MRKLTKDEVERLRGLESEKFMKELENIYKDDEEALTEICRKLDKERNESV